MTTVVLNNKKVTLSPSDIIGQGGEAEIFKLGSQAVKIYKDAGHQDFKNQPAAQQAAKQRIAVHQTKLRDFPKNLPAGVIGPDALAFDSTGKKVVGYAMPLISNSEVLLRYSDKSFRSTGVDPNLFLPVFNNLHGIVDGLHQAGVVIGDFNDLNVLTTPAGDIHIIDADSMQFGKYLCYLFTSRFVDPLLCDPKASSPQLKRQYVPDSDWYAYQVMLMQFLLYVDPYGGIYKPKDSSHRMPHGQRPLHRITIFHPEVRYPKPAIPYDYLPDDLLDRFHRTFEKDERGVFPLALLQSFRWTTCVNCGLIHARTICPACATGAPGYVKERVEIRGTVTATTIFRTNGVILTAAIQNGKMQWLYHENNRYIREDDRVIVENSKLDPRVRYRISGKTTLMAKENTLIINHDKNEVEKAHVDKYGTLPVIDANGSKFFWMREGQIIRKDHGRLAIESIAGEALKGQTLFWVGEEFGFGFWRAGGLTTGFIFDNNGRAVREIDVPALKGNVVDATCVFSKVYAWFLISVKEHGKVINKCYVIDKVGNMLASAEAEDRDGSWLGGIRGKTAVAGFMLAPTDDGVVRIEPDNGKQLTITREFPDTESFVDASSHLHIDHTGLYTVNAHEIVRLQIK